MARRHDATPLSDLRRFASDSARVIFAV